MKRLIENLEELAGRDIVRARANFAPSRAPAPKPGDIDRLGAFRATLRRWAGLDAPAAPPCCRR